MSQIILREKTVHLANYTSFTRVVDQYKNTSPSQLYQPPSIPFSSCEYCKVFKNSFFIEHPQKQPFADVILKIGALKSLANFTATHLS